MVLIQNLLKSIIDQEADPITIIKYK
jgi:hypothetical protein